MLRMTSYDNRSIDERFAAIGVAYEQYVERLRVLNRLRSRREKKSDPDHAAQLAEARRLVEEAYQRWLALARPDLVAAQRSEDGRGGRS
jgi:hypothetical protein